MSRRAQICRSRHRVHRTHARIYGAVRASADVDRSTGTPVDAVLAGHQRLIDQVSAQRDIVVVPARNTASTARSGYLTPGSKHAAMCSRMTLRLPRMAGIDSSRPSRTIARNVEAFARSGSSGSSGAGSGACSRTDSLKTSRATDHWPPTMEMIPPCSTAGSPSRHHAPEARWSPRRHWATWHRARRRKHGQSLFLGQQATQRIGRTSADLVPQRARRVTVYHPRQHSRHARVPRSARSCSAPRHPQVRPHPARARVPSSVGRCALISATGFPLLTTKKVPGAIRSCVEFDLVSARQNQRRLTCTTTT